MDDFEYLGSELELFADATNWKNYWSQQIRPYLGQRVIDVGAGLGSNLELLWQPGASWLCIEPDTELASKTRDTVSRMQLKDQCQVWNGTLAKLDPDEKSDTIIYIDVLEHIEDDSKELETALEHLRPGGHLIVLAPAYQWLFSPFDEAVGHYRRYHAKSLMKAAPDNVRLKKLRYLDSVGLLASAANKLILKSSVPSRSQIGFWDRVLVPSSRMIDRLLAYQIGKSILAVWQREDVPN